MRPLVAITILTLALVACGTGSGDEAEGMNAAEMAQMDGASETTEMNVQEMATCRCENLPVKVLLLNNQHLGMVMQWEDRFMQGRRAHTPSTDAAEPSP